MTLPRELTKALHRLSGPQVDALYRCLCRAEPAVARDVYRALCGRHRMTFHVDASRVAALSPPERHALYLTQSGKDKFLDDGDRAALTHWQDSFIAKIYAAVTRVEIIQLAEPVTEINIAVQAPLVHVEPPIVNVENTVLPARKRRTKTRVTEHDDKGRIKAFVQEEVG